MSDLDAIVRGRIAEWVMRSLLRDMRRELRDNGKPAPPFAEAVIVVLNDAAGRPLDEAMSAIGRRRSIVDDETWVTISTAARSAGLSKRHVRRLAQTGQVRGKKVGARVWQVDESSLLNVLKHKGAA